MRGPGRRSSMSGRGIFISYRRADSQGEAGRIDDHLRPRYGSPLVHRDVCTIPVGADLSEHLVQTVAACSVVIVVIGHRWLESFVRGQGRRDDWLRIEIRTALLNPDVTVIPVLVQDARMPQPEELPPDIRTIARIAALELSDSRWDYDIGRLIAAVDELVPPLAADAGKPETDRPAVVERTRRAEIGRARHAACIAAILLAACVGAGLMVAVGAARTHLPVGLDLVALAGAALLTLGAVVAGADLLYPRAPRLRAVALALVVAGTLLVSIGTGGVLLAASGGPPGPPPGERPGERPGEPPDGPPGDPGRQPGGLLAVYAGSPHQDGLRSAALAEAPGVEHFQLDIG